MLKISTECFDCWLFRLLDQAPHCNKHMSAEERVAYEEKIEAAFKEMSENPHPFFDMLKRGR